MVFHERSDSSEGRMQKPQGERCFSNFIQGHTKIQQLFVLKIVTSQAIHLKDRSET